jgi:hypothetical protein
MQISTKEETGKKKGCGNQWKDGKATVTEKILRRKIGLGNDLSESGCEDQPFNERANL